MVTECLDPGYLSNRLRRNKSSKTCRRAALLPFVKAIKSFEKKQRKRRDE